MVTDTKQVFDSNVYLYVLIFMKHGKYKHRDS
jgi:hypothetical protein